ncbi:hypothetical protein Ciccas_004922 [Cichlidogyrus casuarinus]|uniref:Uncharacterized protein n=1 Tax=Cichlidogyrus casuarinus TaxID=1844966 RepID=A0ABD2QA52_9PLAT
MFVRDERLSDSEFTCFLERFHKIVLASKYLKKPCNVHGFTTNTTKDQIDHEYRDGTRCFHFSNIDRVVDRSILFLHGATDYENSSYKPSIFSLSLSQDFPKIEKAQLSRAVRNHLHSAWDSTLGADEVDALASRILPTVIRVQDKVGC